MHRGKVGEKKKKSCEEKAMEKGKVCGDVSVGGLPSVARWRRWKRDW
jgi:hypothetical protein